MDMSPTDVARAINLIQDGRSQYYMASVLNVTRSKVQRVSSIGDIFKTNHQPKILESIKNIPAVQHDVKLLVNQFTFNSLPFYDYVKFNNVEFTTPKPNIQSQHIDVQKSQSIVQNVVSQKPLRKVIKSIIFLDLIYKGKGEVKGLTQEQKDHMKAVHKKCQEDPKTTADEDLVKKVRDGIFTEDEKVKIHMLCMQQGFNIITADGKVNEEKLKSKWADHFDADSQAKLQKCLVNKDTAVETSWALLKCEWDVVGEQIKAHRDEHDHHHH
ncbi:unnamed protein product [Brassicogethes aeneus]|uniref:Uncharacterized protein n=1 Tax=Brassicogethes aeneus TaxID=1431903 RepID=A0A9P0FJ98_BRAAE|nr:unnamed protein product [Brassicogethes aeneus]